MNQRDRLIELIQNSVNGCARHWAGIIADHLLDNGVIVPPCKVGDTVYWSENGTTIKSGTVREFGHEDWTWAVINVGKSKVVVLRCTLLYLTREEAEEALKERQNES